MRSGNEKIDSNCITIKEGSTVSRGLHRAVEPMMMMTMKMVIVITAVPSVI